MNNSRLLKESFLSAAGVVIYVFLVSGLMVHGNELFGRPNSFLGPAMVLLLLVLSTLITGLLVLGRPIWLYLEKEKKAAVKLLLFTT
ncbi:unnamed protein product, partial [marine sediment metagenome]